MDPEVTFALEKKIETCEKKILQTPSLKFNNNPPMTHEVKVIRQ